jgi:hypothetical protein
MTADRIPNRDDDSRHELAEPIDPPRPILPVDVPTAAPDPATDAPCIAGDHYPNADGTACAYCGLPAESIAPDPVTLYTFAYWSDDATHERELAQEARAGGRAVLRYYADMRGAWRGSGWTISLRPSHDHVLDPLDAEYQRTYRARRDAGWSGFTRPHWPIMRAAPELAR